MKAQEALEPVLIVIVLAFVIGLLLLFSLKIFSNEDAKDALATDSREATSLVKILSSMPELSCGAVTTKDTFCIDKAKAEQFSAIDPDIYRALLGNTNVSIVSIDLVSGDREEIMIYSDLGSATYRTSRISFTLHDPLTDEMRFATMTVTRGVG